MAWGESKAWKRGSAHQKLYQSLLDNAMQAPARNSKRRKVLHPEDMPWEMARQGLLKHLLNEQMNTRMETRWTPTCRSFRRGAARAGTGIWPRSVFTWRKAGATTCTRTATWRSPTPTTGSLKTR